MIQSPIVKVLSTIRRHGVKALLMGGQACVFYGAAEFSKDADIVLLADPANVERLRIALAELEARQVYVPALELAALRRGHGVHFKCRAAENARVDIMSVLRGVEDFASLWERRTVFEDRDGNQYDVLGLQDLVQAKKTQRAKDWPMIARLIEANYVENTVAPSDEQVRFWLAQMRTSQYLIEVAQRFPERARETAAHRPLIDKAIAEDVTALEDALMEEERAEQQRDRVHWQPLRQELETMRRLRGET